MTDELSANTTLSHYRIVAKLGAGGMGEVWLAEDTRLDRQVAIKLLPSAFTQDADRVRRFMQEAKAASALNHPNIITVHDIGECDAGRFLVMELVSGRTLRSVIAEDNSPETVLRLGTQIAMALSAAHSAGITHRDIKPDNIMVRDDGYVKVLDFGLARLLPTESAEEAATLANLTTPGMVMGTVAYMSPEQARGDAVQPPSDIFALGIVLYELATGQHPFRADSLVGFLHAITLTAPASPATLNPRIPTSLDALILRMLEKDAGKRPCAADIAEILQKIERGADSATPAHTEDHQKTLLSNSERPAPVDEGFWVAVLPFKSRPASADLEALAEGLSEDIVTGLSRFSYLRVIARSSTLRFAGDSSDIRSIGRELGARYVMEGSLRQSGSMLRLVVQLVDATTGAHLWAETYDRAYSAEQTFSLQDDLVPRIVSTVADAYGILPHSMSQAVRSKPSATLTPYEALLRSFSYVERVTAEEHAEARSALERAVEQSPSDSDCWAMLSILLTDEHIHGFSNAQDLLTRALQFARRAVDTNPLNHRAHQALAWALCYRKESSASRHAAERAIALNPMDASAMAYVGQTIAFGGGWERGCELLERAMQLNPHHPGWYRYASFLKAYQEGDYNSALDVAVKINMPGVSLVSVALAACYGQLGQVAEGRASVRELLAERPDFASSARELLEKLWDSGLVDRLLDGLHKAGMKVNGGEVLSEPPSTRQSSGEKRTHVQAGRRDQSHDNQGSLQRLLVADSTSIASASPSIAVLPFVNLSPDPDNEFFADGLTDEVIADLSAIHALRVISRTSTIHFKGSNKELQTIAQELNVRYLLEGSVRRAGTSLRITTQLIDAESDKSLWAEKYSGSVEDVFAIQEEISRKIVSALELRLTDTERQDIAERPIDNPAAYDCYLRARQEVYLFSEAGLDRAQKLVDTGLRLIGENSLLLATRGLVSWYYLNFSIRPERRYLDEAAVYAERALDQDSQNYLCIFLRGLVASKRGEIESAVRDLVMAHEARPGDSMVLNELIRHLLTAGQEQSEWAQPIFQLSLRIDPLAPLNWAQAAWRHFGAGRPRETVDAARSVFDLTERGNPSRVYAAYYLALAGQRDDAIRVFEEEGSALSGNAYGSVSLFLSRALLHDADGALGHVTPQLEQAASWTEYLALFLADGYSLIGNHDRALRWLRAAVDAGFINYPYLTTKDPFLSNVLSDERCTELMKEVKLRWEGLTKSLANKARLTKPIEY